MKSKTVWNKPENEFIAETMENGRKCYYGQYTDKAVPFAFRLAEQPPDSRYRCRGTVWAVPPDARGKIFDTKKSRNVVTEVSLNTTNENAIKDRILHSVWDLWGSHAEAIYRAMYGAFARAAADITPQIAAQLYAERYEDSLYRLGQTPKEHRKAAKIRAYFAELPLKPMAQVSERDLQPVLKKLKDAPKADQKLLRGFWNYGLERRYCQGANPFPEQQSKRSDPKRKSNAVFIPEHLSEGEIAHVFQTLLKQAAKTPMACAAALQLGGGFSIAQIQQLRWRDVLFEPDMVRIRTRDDVCGGSTHDRTRPIMPDAAEVLRCRYEALCKETTARQLENRFLLEKNKDGAILASSELVRYNNRILAELGVRTTAVTAPGEEAYSRRLLLATYAHQVMYAAGLGCAEKGTGNFLCGRSLMGDTTSCDYVGYTSPEGQRLLAAYLRRASPERYTGEYSPHISENNAECLANSTRQTVRVEADIVIPPGGEVVLTSAHGVAGAGKVRELLPDGTLRRKPHEKKNKV